MSIRRPSSRRDEQALLDFGDRVTDGDAAPPTSDLESTFLRVQRAMRPTTSSATSGTMPDRLKTRAWEDIVQNTAAIPTGRAAGHPGNRRHPRSFPSVPLPRMAWTSAANIALAVLVVVAGFGAWRAFDGGFGGGGNGPAPSEGRYAQAPMTPVPIATAETAEAACDFSTSAPLYQGVDSAPTEGTALYVTSDGIAMLHCGDQAEDTLVANNVQYAQPYGVPNTVQLHVGTGDEATLIYLDIATGKQMEVNMEGFTSYLGHMNQSQRFLIAPAPGDPFSWGVHDVETMTSVSLNEVTGGSFSTQGNLVVSAPAGGAAMAFASGAYESEGTAHIGGDKSGAGNDIAIVNDDLATTTWVTIPDDFPPVSNISISDDGATLAVISNPFNQAIETGESVTVIGLVDVATNQEIVRTDWLATPNGAFFAWVEDGAAAVYATEDAVYRLPAEPDATPTALYESDTMLRYIDAVMGPNVVLVQEEITPGGRESRVVMVTTDTGDVTQFEGNAWSPGTTALIPFHFPLAPIVLEAQEQGAGSWNIVDPRTGETILSAESELSTSATIEEVDGTLSLQQVRIVAQDTPVSAVLPGDGRIVIIDLGQVEPVVSEVMLPEGIEADGYSLGTVSLAPDGSAIIVETKLDEATRYWTLDLGEESDEWTQLPEGVEVSYLYASE